MPIRMDCRILSRTYLCQLVGEYMEAIIVALITGGLSFLGIVYTSKQQHSITIEEVKNELSLIKKDIKSLEEKGLATKLRNQKDRRAYDVSLTDYGRDLKPKIIKDLNCWVDLITKGVKPDEMNQFLGILRKTAKKAVELTEGK